jgi:ankyrin repeat protein
LHLAVNGGHKQIVQSLLRAGADPNIQDAVSLL